jgi:CheY-like chemotaxis protein/anti-sigma regulatory factor (Ser/Thr protein kinase)
MGPGLTGWVLGDPTRVRQVLGNLLSNAIKFTRQGHVTVDADIVVQEGGSRQLHMVVRDTGIGIDPERLANLFVPYAQAGASVTRTHGGTGLGLSISRQFCRLMHGDLTVESVPGRGSAFSATLRVVPTEAPVEVESEEAEERFARLLATRPLHILAAEDNATNQLVLRSLLRKFDLRLDIVPNGLEALDACRASRPDLVLMDVHMPVMNGVEATRNIRQLEAESGLPRIPIIGLSANAMRHQVDEYLTAGMDANVAKPIRRAELLQVISAVLNDSNRPEGGA